MTSETSAFANEPMFDLLLCGRKFANERVRRISSHITAPNFILIRRLYEPSPDAATNFLGVATAGQPASSPGSVDGRKYSKASLGDKFGQPFQKEVNFL